jgi:voltage-gated potassium channel
MRGERFRTAITAFAHRAFHAPTTAEFRAVNYILAFATLASVLSVVLGSMEAYASYGSVWNIIEWSAVAIFFAEYLLRMLTERSPLAYAMSFYGVIDLLAIAPTILGIGNFTFLKFARTIRAIRFRRMAQITKISRIPEMDRHLYEGIPANTHEQFRRRLAFATLTLFAITIVLSGLLYALESENPEFSSISNTLVWILQTWVMVPQSELWKFSATESVIVFAVKLVFLILLGCAAAMLGENLGNEKCVHKNNGDTPNEAAPQ